MNTENVGKIRIVEFSNNTVKDPFAFSPYKVYNYCAMTDSTSILILLNSSKQHQAPALAKPLKNLATIL